MSKNTNLIMARVICSATFLLLAILLPFLTSKLPAVGLWEMSMQFSVILCGFVCGPVWGMAVGAIAPILRYFIFGSPDLMPEGLVMAFQLLTFGFLAGLLYRKLEKNLFYIYVSLVTAMVGGRIVWAIVMFILILAGAASGSIGFSLVWNQTVVNSLAGIIIQLVAIPAIVTVLKNNRLMLN